MSENEIESSIETYEPLSLREATHLLQKTLITRALAETNGNKAAAARLLQMNRTTMLMMLKRLNEIDGVQN